ncbi:MAG TPA: hypothetical protein VFN42_02060 [Acetobacteraceae bacterium]|nr:hypothetical protein [Acetobacteraceae bacterium]
MSENVKPLFDNETPTPATSSDPLSLDGSLMQAAEARMRRALGLEGGAKLRAPERAESPQRQAERFTPGHNGHNGHKRRFVQDGEVPVTVVSSRRDAPGEVLPHRGPPTGAGPNRLEAAETALNQEIATRQQAERALHEAQAVIHDLQTKLGHAELARIEAVDGLHREQEAVAALRAELHACEERLRSAERSVRPRRERSVSFAPATLELTDDDADLSDPHPIAAPKPESARRGRPPGKKAARSKLVRWWIKDEAKPD